MSTDIMEKKKKKVKKRAGKVIHSMVTQHAMDKAKEIRQRYGPIIDYPTVLRILEDRRCIRYPLKLQFVTEGIEPGMFGKTEQVSEDASDGYVVSLHQSFEDRPDVLPALILYQSVLVNYGDLATADDAEIFASTLLDMDRDDYYAQIVELTDALWEN